MKGAVLVSTAVEITVLLFIVGGFTTALANQNNKLEAHQKDDAAVGQEVAAQQATIAAMSSDIKDIKDSQKQILQTVMTMNKRI